MLRVVVCAVLVAVLAGCGADSPATREQTADTDAVSVVEFLDFNCPACKSAQTLLRPLAFEKGVVFEVRHFPLSQIPGHETSFAAAVAYECLADAGFAVEAEAALFDNQGDLTEEFLAQLPSDYALPVPSDAYQACRESKQVEARVQADAAAARKLDLPGTPAVLINGELTEIQRVPIVVRELLDATQ